MKKNTKTQKWINKKSLVASISELSGLSKDESTQALKAMMLSITNTLKDGHQVRLPGFGSFRVLHRSKSDGRNPLTGKAIKIPAKKIPKFRPSPMLKASIT
jgi:DNA-binding protein HU-beta